MQIEGLQQSSVPSAAKKVVYGPRKRKGPSSKDKDDALASPAPESRPLSPTLITASLSPSSAPAELPNKADDVKDEWDVSSGEEDNGAALAPSVKDSWDASSEDEESAPPPSSENKPTNAPVVLSAPLPSQPVERATSGPYIAWCYVSLLIKQL